MARTPPCWSAPSSPSPTSTGASGRRRSSPSSRARRRPRTRSSPSAAQHIAHFKCPAAVEFGDLPKTSTGKVQKFVLREREWAGPRRSASTETRGRVLRARTRCTSARDKVLQVVLGINVAMFLDELVAGLISHLTALIADSVDMLGDAIVYGFSLYVVGRGFQWQARGALLKGARHGGLRRSASSRRAVRGWRAASRLTPASCGSSALVALVANASVLVLLSRHRSDDINMRWAWLRSETMWIANGAVIVAGIGVGETGAAWPDIRVGLAIAALFALEQSALIRQALASSQPSKTEYPTRGRRRSRVASARRRDWTSRAANTRVQAARPAGPTPDAFALPAGAPVRRAEMRRPAVRCERAGDRRPTAPATDRSWHGGRAAQADFPRSREGQDSGRGPDLDGIHLEVQAAIVSILPAASSGRTGVVSRETVAEVGNT